MTNNQIHTDNSRDVINQVASAYNQFGREYHLARKGSGLFFNEFLEVPATLSKIPEKMTGLRVLDAGCGSGIYSVEMARRGATVMGVDLSATMIELAESEKPFGLTNLAYQVGNICSSGFESGQFDLIVSSYVLENVPDLQCAFSEFSRLLKPGGVLLFSVSHPCRALAIRQTRAGLDNDKEEVWLLEHYFSGGMRVSDLGNGLKVTKFRYTLSDYFSAALSAGLILNSLDEPKPIIEGKERDPTSYEVACRLPQVLLIKMSKNDSRSP